MALLDVGDLERYAIVQKLGEGGMGVVYRARDTERGVDVALKTLSRMGPAALYRFKKEFRALADIRHPNLVALYELVAAPGRWFFTMELVEGRPFDRYVCSRPDPAPAPANEHPTLVLPLRRTGDGGSSSSGSLAHIGPHHVYEEGKLRSCLGQLCDAVAHLHDKGRLHRDLKPSNVLVTPEGRLVVLDFGLVVDDTTPLDDHTPEQAVVGTPTYMAPEQAMCLPLGPTADWYAVGTILFQALTGRLPFEGSIDEILVAKRRRDGPSPRTWVSSVPADLDRLCLDLLKADPDERPDDEEVLYRVRGRRSVAPRRPRTSSAPPPPPRRPFVGRAREMAFLEGAMRTVGAGRPVLVRVSGRSGMGKTTLVRIFLRQVSEREDAVVLRGRCYERESVPYKAFDSLVDSLSRYLRRLPVSEATALMPRDAQVLARVFPVLLRVDAVAASPRRDLEVQDDHELRRRAFAALKELLARIADRRRLVLHIDDLQWSDADSIELLAEVLGPPDAPSALVLVSHRSEEAGVGEPLGSLERSPRHGGEGPAVRHLQVGPLSEEESIALVRAHLPSANRLSDVRLQHIAAEAEGSPFLLEAFAQHVAAGHAGGPIHLEDVLGARLRALPPEARRVLEVVATSGRPVSQAVACRAAGIEGSGDEAVSVLRAASLVWTQGVRSQDRVDVYHDRIREHVLARIPAGALRELHRRLATALRQEGDVDHEAIAHHFEAAGDRVQAVFHAVEAAHRAADALAFDRAARLYRFALTRLPDPDSRRLRLEEGLADALRNAGRGVEAAHAYERAAELARGDRVLEHWRSAAEQLLRSGHVDDALQVAAPLLEAAGLKMPSSRAQALASALWLHTRLRLRGLRYEPTAEAEVEPQLLRRIDTCWAVGHGLVAVNAVQAGDLVTRASLLALEAGEPRRVAMALAFQAILMVLIGVRGHAAVLDVAEEAASRSGDRYAIALVTGMRGFVGHLVDGDLELNYRLMARAERIFRTLDHAANFEISTTHFQMLASLFYLGRWRDVSARLPGYVREAESRGDLYGAATLVLLYGDTPSLARDDPDEGNRLVESYLARWRERDDDLQLGLGLVCQIRLGVYEGRAAAMIDHVEERMRAAKRSGMLRGKWIRVLLLDARARARIAAALASSGSWRSGLLRGASSDVRKLWRSGHPIGHAMAEMHAGCIELARGRTEQGVLRLEAAESRYDALGMKVHAACCGRVAGRLVGGDEGLERMVASDDLLRAEAVVAPERLARMITPSSKG